MRMVCSMFCGANREKRVFFFVAQQGGARVCAETAHGNWCAQRLECSSPCTAAHDMIVPGVCKTPLKQNSNFRCPAMARRLVKNVCAMACGDHRDTPSAAEPDPPKDEPDQAAPPAANGASDTNADPAAAAASVARQARKQTPTLRRAILLDQETKYGSDMPRLARSPLRR